MTMRTAGLWLQYQDMIDILKTFTCIKAEWTGNWNLHLQAVRDMLPYLAASGHQLYTKSAYVYLQTMTDLSKTHPSVHKKFCAGYMSFDVDKTVEEFTFRKADEVATMSSRSAVKIKGQSITINPQLMFQWLVLVGQCCKELSSLSNMSSVVFLLHYLGHPPFPYRQTSHSWLMPSGNQSMNHNGNQAKISDMFLMATHYSITYHGLEDPHMMVCVKCMLIM